jgi:hypothetical protein
MNFYDFFCRIAYSLIAVGYVKYGGGRAEKAGSNTLPFH